MCTAVVDAAQDRLVYINISVSDFKIIAAIRIGTNPGFIVYGRSLVAEIGKGHQIALVTFKTLGKTRLFHLSPPPSLE
jgi:hypothetical protein